MKRSNIKLDEYTKLLEEKRGKEVIKEQLENIISLKEGKGITSPVSDMPSEELKLVQQFIHRSNLMNIGEALPSRKKYLVLRKFFKHKRNQQVEIYSGNEDAALRYTGKVNTIGRDFVTITSLKERIWIPFHSIKYSKVPFGLPEISNSHQHFVYDDELRIKLITRFSETVAAKDTLIQQFFEETLQTNLQTWKGTRVIVSTKQNGYLSGKVKEAAGEVVIIKNFDGEHPVTLAEITSIRTVRFFHLLSLFGRSKRLNRTNMDQSQEQGNLSREEWENER